MKLKNVVSREYKVMLKAGMFHGDEDEALSQASLFWEAYRSALEGRPASERHKHELEDEMSKIKKRRTVRFFDTECLMLRSSGYVLRERLDVLDDYKREVTLKYRHSDRYVSADKDMSSAADDTDTKFEEDITSGGAYAARRSIFSHSTDAGVEADEGLSTLKDVGRLFPGLPSELNGYDDDLPIGVVNGFTAREVVIGGGEIDFGKEEADCALTLWYDRSDADGLDPKVVEFSFKYKDKDEEYTGKTALGAHEAFGALLGEDMREWVELEGITKTRFVYEMA